MSGRLAYRFFNREPRSDGRVSVLLTPRNPFNIVLISLFVWTLKEDKEIKLWVNAKLMPFICNIWATGLEEDRRGVVR